MPPKKAPKKEEDSPAKKGGSSKAGFVKMEIAKGNLKKQGAKIVPAKKEPKSKAPAKKAPSRFTITNSDAGAKKIAKLLTKGDNVAKVIDRNRARGALIEIENRTEGGITTTRESFDLARLAKKIKISNQELKEDPEEYARRPALRNDKEAVLLGDMIGGNMSEKLNERSEDPKERLIKKFKLPKNVKGKYRVNNSVYEIEHNGKTYRLKGTPLGFPDVATEGDKNFVM